jgi:hypothetical protein
MHVDRPSIQFLLGMHRARVSRARLFPGSVIPGPGNSGIVAIAVINDEKYRLAVSLFFNMT